MKPWKTVLLRIVSMILAACSACGATDTVSYSNAIPVSASIHCPGAVAPSTFTFTWSNGTPGIVMYNRFLDPPRLADTVVTQLYAGRAMTTVHVFLPCMTFMDSLAMHDPAMSVGKLGSR